MSLIPDVSPKAFSASAVIVGYLLIDDLTANEQNALGNWLMLFINKFSKKDNHKKRLPLTIVLKWKYSRKC